MVRAFAPGIEIEIKAEIYENPNEDVFIIRDGEEVDHSTYTSEEMEALNRGELVLIEYNLHINAISHEIAERKGKNYARTRHPADMLNITSNVDNQRSSSGVFSEAGPQEEFEVNVSVEK